VRGELTAGTSPMGTATRETDSLMTLRERILSVYCGETPDLVPFMLDLSHWFYHRHRLPWDLSVAYQEPERELLGYHLTHGIGFYLPNLSAFYRTAYGADVQAEVVKATHGGAPAITWRITTPLGTIERTRVWEERSYSWAIRDWGVRSERDLRVLGYALGSRTFTSDWGVYGKWVEAIGDCGVAYVGAGYSAVGYLLSLWMGVERTTYAICDWPGTVREVVDQISESNLRLIDLLATSPAEIIIMGDNFSSDLQPPHFVARWSADYYREAIRRLHAAGRHVAVHIDGRLRGLLRLFGELGADCADAVTPTPMGDLTPAECREEAGPGLILSGGVSPELWLPTTPLEEFRAAVSAWLDLRHGSPRLIAGAGDQVPPGADEDRIMIMRDMVAEHGRY
jgi:hypothetical protein